MAIKERRKWLVPLVEGVGGKIPLDFRRIEGGLWNSKELVGI